MSATPVHYTVSLRRIVADHELTSGETSVIYALWSLVRDPFDPRPTLRASYAELAQLTGLATSTIEGATRKLVRVGAIVKGGSARGHGTAYTLLRPHHRAEDSELNPFNPAPSASDVVNSTTKSSSGSRRRRPLLADATPAVRPDRVAALLEDVAGMEPRYHDIGRRKGDRRPVIPYSEKAGDPSAVRAAQRYIAAHGWDRYVAVCRAACEYRDVAGPTQDERLRLFDRTERLHAVEVLADSMPTPLPAQTNGRALEPEGVVGRRLRSSEIEVTDEMRAEYIGASDDDIRALLSGEA